MSSVDPAAIPVSPPLPAVYHTTVFRVPAPPRQFPDRFAIVTAFNPMDRPCSPEWNAELNTRLHLMLQSIDAALFEAIGCSRDLTHQEPGWAFRGGLNEALEIARRFEQRALWWIENDRLNLVDCSEPVLVDVDSFRARLIPPDSPAP